MPLDRGAPQPSDDRYSVTVGQLVGNYRIEALLGEGGMGVVFRAVHKDIGRRAAVKVLYRTFARDPEFVTRFLNEARAVNLVGHPGLVEIFEFGCLPDDTPYIIMEFLEGQSLDARLDGSGKRRLPLGQALSICRQLAVALAAAHDKGVVHRDLKPENVMLVRDPLAPGTERTKILDFGIAKVEPVGRKGPSLTRTGTTMGSPLYMAPEQCQELSTVTDRADVYALGIILYQLLAGRTPFVSDLAPELMVMHVRSAPPPIRDFAPSTPEPVVALVDEMLAKEPAKRPRMHKVAETLARLGITTQEGATTQRSWQQPNTRQAALGGFFSIAAALLIIGLVWHFRQPRTVAPDPAGIQSANARRDAGAAASPPSGDMIEWMITTEPPGAQIIDEASGDQMGHTPLTIKRPRRPGREAVVLHLDGYRDVTLQLDGGRDLSIDRQLVAATAAPPPGPRPVVRKRRNKDSLITPLF